MLHGFRASMASTAGSVEVCYQGCSNGSSALCSALRAESAKDSSPALATILGSSCCGIGFLRRRCASEERARHLRGDRLRWGICGLRRSVGLLEGLGLLNRRRVDVCNGVVTVALALDAEDDE